MSSSFLGIGPPGGKGGLGPGGGPGGYGGLGPGGGPGGYGGLGPGGGPGGYGGLGPGPGIGGYGGLGGYGLGGKSSHQNHGGIIIPFLSIDGSYIS